MAKALLAREEEEEFNNLLNNTSKRIVVQAMLVIDAMLQLSMMTKMMTLIMAVLNGADRQPNPIGVTIAEEATADVLRVKVVSVNRWLTCKRFNSKSKIWSRKSEAQEVTCRT